jgi:hypothetical protein
MMYLHYPPLKKETGGFLCKAQPDKLRLCPLYFTTGWDIFTEEIKKV